LTQTQTTATPSNESFADLLNQSFQEMTSIEGSVVSGTVISIEKDMILIDVGLKCEGRVPLREFGNSEEETKINVTYDSYRFTENNAIGKGEKSDILTMQHDILKKDSKYPNFAHALFAHSKMLELFIEYEDVTGNKFYIPF